MTRLTQHDRRRLVAFFALIHAARIQTCRPAGTLLEKAPSCAVFVAESTNVQAAGSVG